MTGNIFQPIKNKGYAMSKDGIWYTDWLTTDRTPIIETTDTFQPIPVSVSVDNQWKSIARSPSLWMFAAVSYDGTTSAAMTSTDWLNRTIQTTPGDTWNKIVWAESLWLFVAVWQWILNQQVMTSPDGVTRTFRNSPQKNRKWLTRSWSLLVAVAHDHNSSTDCIMTSTDGVTRTSRTNPATGSSSWWLIAVARNWTKFIAIPKTNALWWWTWFTSTDWTTRTAITLPSTLYFWDIISDWSNFYITWVVNTYVWSPSWPEHSIIVSSDWTTRTETKKTIGQYEWVNMAYNSNDGDIVAVWSTRWYAWYDVVTSLYTDLTDVTDITYGTIQDQAWNAVAFSPTLWIYCAVSSDGDSSRIAISADWYNRSLQLASQIDLVAIYKLVLWYYFDDTWSTTVWSMTTANREWDRILHGQSYTINQWLGKMVILWDSSTMVWLYYINGNDDTYLYIDGIIAWDALAADSFEIVESVWWESTVWVSDWEKIYAASKTWTSTPYGEVIEMRDFWSTQNNVAIENYYDRLFFADGKKLRYSTLKWFFINDNDFIDMKSNIVDLKTYKNRLYIFTSNWAYVLTGTWYTSFVVERISEFSLQSKWYPTIVKDYMFINDDWAIKVFDTQESETINKKLSPYKRLSTYPGNDLRLFATDKWLLFMRNAAENRLYELDVEELISNKKVVITDFNQPINTQLQWDLFWGIMQVNRRYIKAIWDKMLYESISFPYESIRVKMNRLKFNRKIFIERIEVMMSTDAWFPDTILYTINWTEYTATKNTAWSQTSYPIRKMTDNLFIDITAANDTTITEFNIYYKV